MSNFKSIATHNGLFHAGEVTACALLINFASASRAIERTRDVGIIEAADIVVDVGGLYYPPSMRFDHHDTEYHGTIIDDILHVQSCAGMVLSHLEPKMAPGLAQYLRDQFIIGVDATHAFGLDRRTSRLSPKEWKGHLNFSGVIRSFNTDDPFGNDQDCAFMAAVNFTIDLVKRLVSRHEKIMADSASDPSCTSVLDAHGVAQMLQR